MTKSKSPFSRAWRAIALGLGTLGGTLLATPLVARADAEGLHPRFDAAYLHQRSSESALELGMAGLVFLDTDRALELGPRVGFLTAGGAGLNRQSWYLGAQGSMWIFNLFGPGLGADWIASSSLERDHYRIEPMLDTRLVHVGTRGALALRIGVPYEQSLGWGFRAGVTLEFLP